MSTLVDPLAPCGYCRRCAIHDDPAGCLTVEAYVREQAPLSASLRAQLDECTDRELTAYWNIQQFPGLKVTGDEGILLALKLLVVDGLLTERGIPHEYGKLTNRVTA